MANMSAKFDEEAQNGLVWPWPLTSDLQNQ